MQRERKRPEDRERATHGSVHVGRHDRESQVARSEPKASEADQVDERDSGRRCVTLAADSGGDRETSRRRANRRFWLVSGLVLCAAAPAPIASAGERFDTVVIDAGHGGSDTGAKGFAGSFEKDVALAVARNLAARLRARGLWWS